MEKKINMKKMLCYAFIVITYLQFINISIIKKILYDNYIYICCGMMIFITLLTVKEKRFKLNKRRFICWILILSISIFSISVNRGGIGSIIVEILTPIILFAFSNIKFNNRELNYMYILNIIIGFFTVYRVISNPKGYLVDSIFFNPNLSAQLLIVITIFVNILSIKLNKNKIKSFIYNCIFLIGLFYSESRTGIILLVLFLFFLYFVPKKILMNKILQKIVLIITIILGTIIPFIYVNMYNNDYNIDIEFSEKNFFSGRQVIWSNILTNLDNPQNVLFGLGSKFAYRGEYLAHVSIHNMFLMVIFNGGIVLFILFFGYIYFYMSNIIDNNIKSLLGCIAFYGIIIIFMNGYFETMFLWQPINVICCLMISLFKSGSLNEELIENNTKLIE